MILTITLNPTIDKSTAVGKIEPDSKLRCDPMKHEPGGGGINVSKALKKLGCASKALFPAGGYNGMMLKSLLQLEQIDTEVIAVEKETRENFVVLETSTNKQFRFNLPGDPTSIPLVDKVIDYIQNNRFEYIIGSGSLLPGLADDAYAQIAKVAIDTGAKFILDTSGPALQAAVDKGVYLLKPNIGELARLCGIQWLETDGVEAAARSLIGQGNVTLIAVSMGKDGAMLITKDRAYKVVAPEVEKKSTVGAGDSMVAGMVYMLSQGKSLEEVIRFGVACGTAATMNAGTELFDKEDAEQLFATLKVQ
ncbi:MAG TPA: 1-phosphofructokinase family hexose kinase [Flavisolibacter sp.]|nr:1-phosphofructokinase family hexose kinase [Flavisolibacter sp.]